MRTEKQNKDNDTNKRKSEKTMNTNIATMLRNGVRVLSGLALAGCGKATFL